MSEPGHDENCLHERDTPRRGTTPGLSRHHGHLCAGWVGCHDMGHNLAVRMHADELDLDAVLDYSSPVPLFASGAEAAEHGRRDIAHPSAEAQAKAAQLTTIRERKRKAG